MKKRTKIIIAFLALVALVAGGFFADYIISVNKYQDAIANMTYKNIDASNISDGTFVGDCDVNFIYAKVELTVQDGMITNITLLEHRHERGASAEGIERKIVAEQKVDVDAVSGATNSSKVIKKAVDNALSNALKQTNGTTKKLSQYM